MAKSLLHLSKTPDIVFTANAGVVRENTFIASNFRPVERRPEEVLFQKWFNDNGYQVWNSRLLP